MELKKNACIDKIQILEKEFGLYQQRLANHFKPARNRVVVSKFLRGAHRRYLAPTQTDAVGKRVKKPMNRTNLILIAMLTGLFLAGCSSQKNTLIDSWQILSLDEILEQNGRPYAIFLKDTLNIRDKDHKDVRFVFVYPEGGFKRYYQKRKPTMSKEEIAQFKAMLSDPNITRHLFRQEPELSDESRLKWNTYHLEIDQFFEVHALRYSKLCF
jgi:hypothetical protein